MYINLSLEKILKFSGLILALAVCLFLTLYFQKTSSFQYDTWMNNRLQIIKRDLEAMKYVVNFGEKGNNLSLASYFLTIGKNIVSGHIVNEEVSIEDSAQDVPVLLYHGIVEIPDRLSTTEEIFADQMLALKKDGWQTVTLADFTKFINGEKRLPKKSFLLTFDDGRRDSLNGADPILNALGFNAVMFVSTASSLRDTVSFNGYYINEAEIRSMLNSKRWEIGSHAVQETGGYVKINTQGDNGNFLSNKKILPDGRLETDFEYRSRIENELVASKSKLERLFGVKIDTFSYPFSDYGDQTKNNEEAVNVINDIVSKNYLLAFQQSWPSKDLFISNYQGFDKHHLQRVEVATDWSGDYLVDFMNNVSTKPIPFEDDFSSDTGWRNSWGNSVILGNVFSLNANASTTGSFVFLDGTYNWKDYTYTANVEWESGTHLSLIGRFINRDNYISCTFSEDSIRIDEVIDGVSKNKFYSLNWVNIPLKNLFLSMSINGDEVKCYEGSRLVTSISKIGGVPLHGGIGFKVWDKSFGVARAKVSSIKVLGIEEGKSFINSLPEYERNQ